MAFRWPPNQVPNLTCKHRTETTNTSGVAVLINPFRQNIVSYLSLRWKLLVGDAMTSRILFSILIVSFRCLADDSYKGTVGGNPFAHDRADSIRMVKEYVNIHLGREMSHVKCKFWFYNSGRSEYVRVGFPNLDTFHDTNARSASPILGTDGDANVKLLGR
jgi:hypothetical protein